MKILNSSFNINGLFRKVRQGFLLMLDYDGTLAPFVVDRKQAYPYPGVRERLLLLGKMTQGRAVIVSGRSLGELEMLLEKSPGLELWGSHGLERKLSNEKKWCVPLDPKLIEGVKKGIRECLCQVDAKYCEIKPYGVAFHWRGLKEEEMKAALQAIESSWKKISHKYGFDLHHFDGGLELRPQGRHKGHVVQELLQEMAGDIAVAYLGDDATDEEAFKTLGNRGLKVLVRREFRPTLADIQLVPPHELLVFLDHWINGEVFHAADSEP